jgi:hypothetical protein
MRISPLTIATVVLASTLAGSTAHPPGTLARGECIPWEVVDIPTDVYEEITAIDGISSSDVWAVGDSFVYPHPPTIRHWDGQTWTVSTAGIPDGNLFDVDVRAADDAWAVGMHRNHQRTLALHWDGQAWTDVPTPSPQLSFDDLQGVSALGPSDVWAVGQDGYRHGLVIHWDGTSWSRGDFVDHAQGEVFNDVLALSENDVWAAGQWFGGSSSQPFVQHWDGSSWTEVTLPDAHHDGVLRDLDASGPNDVWAVGWEWEGPQFIYRWGGVAWKRFDRVPFGSLGYVGSVSVVSPSNVWVAGVWGNGPPIAARWDGHRWIRMPVQDGNAWFGAIKAFSRTDVWAGGHTAGAGILAERFIGCS